MVLPAGHDPASLAYTDGPDALRVALDAAVPLADVVVDARIDRRADRLQWPEGQLGAPRDRPAPSPVADPHPGSLVRFR